MLAIHEMVPHLHCVSELVDAGVLMYWCLLRTAHGMNHPVIWWKYKDRRISIDRCRELAIWSHHRGQSRKGILKAKPLVWK